MDHDGIGRRMVAAVGEAGARELLDALTRPEADRAALIGRLAVNDDAAWLAEVLTDLEVDEVARLHMIEALRRIARQPSAVRPSDGGGKQPSWWACRVITGN